MGKFAKDSINTSIIIVIGFVFGTLTNLFVYPKLFDKTDLGVFKYITGWATIFAQFCAFGVGTAAIRMYYRFKDKKAHGELKGLLLLVPLSMLVIFIFSFIPLADVFLKRTLNGLPFEGWALITAIIMATVAITFIKTYGSIGTMKQKTPIMFFVNEIMLKVWVLVVFIVYYFEWIGASVFLLLLGGVYLLQLLWILWIIRSYFIENPFTLPAKKTTKPFLSLSLFCLADNISSVLVAQIDMTMIAALSATSLGSMQEYNMALMVTTVIFLPWRSFTATSIPFIAEAFSVNNIQAIATVYSRTSLSLTIFGMIVFVLIFSSIDNIIALIPDDYTIIKYPVLFIGIGKVIDMMFSVNGNIISLSPYYKSNLYFTLITVVLLFFANWALIPVLGINGSAIATAGAMLIFNLLKSGLIYNKYKILPFHPRIVEVLLVMTGIMMVGVYFPDLHRSAFLSLCMRSAVLGAFIYIYLVWRKPSDDMERLRIKTLQRIPVLRKFVK